MEYFLIFSAGAFGALVKDILQDNHLVLPKKINGKLMLGFFGGVIIGGAAGLLIDGSFITAFLAGYSGTSVIEGLIGIKNNKAEASEPSVEDIIRRIAQEESVSPDLAVKVAKCESGLKPNAKNINSPESVDRGIFQINSKYHPHVTDEQAFDVAWSTRFFCKAFKEGHLNWWNASKKCWEKS